MNDQRGELALGQPQRADFVDQVRVHGLGMDEVGSQVQHLRLEGDARVHLLPHRLRDERLAAVRHVQQLVAVLHRGPVKRAHLLHVAEVAAAHAVLARVVDVVVGGEGPRAAEALVAGGGAASLPAADAGRGIHGEPGGVEELANGLPDGVERDCAGWDAASRVVGGGSRRRLVVHRLQRAPPVVGLGLFLLHILDALRLHSSSSLG
mmetsp:Transcript_29293/g.56222  ORF Transcript_29293/g.56222 Transcript_29293/m.56222 type:complete len:207 (-) Transcript_29293:2414-3034(-)